MNTTDFKSKYNNGSTGLFKDNSSGDIGADDARALVTDVGDNFVNKESDGFYSTASTSGTNTFTASVSPTPVGYTDGHKFTIKFGNASTGAATLNLNAQGAKPIYITPSTQADSGDIAASQIYNFVYDASLNTGSGGFLMVGGSSSGGSSSFASLTGEPYDNTALAGEFRKKRTVTASDSITQDDDNALIIFDSASPINFILDELTADTKASFANYGSADVTFVNGSGVVVNGNTVLPARAGDDIATGIVVYDTDTDVTCIIGSGGGGSGTITSVNGDSGPDVSLAAADIPFTPAGDISATDVQAAIEQVATFSDAGNLADFTVLTDAAPVVVDAGDIKEPKFYLETGTSRTLSVSNLRAENSLNQYVAAFFLIKKTVAGDITITLDTDFTNRDYSTDDTVTEYVLSGDDESYFKLSCLVKGETSGANIWWSLAAPAASGTGAVDSVNGETGVVTLSAADIPFTPTGSISATDVQAAIAEVASEAGGSFTFATAADLITGTDTTKPLNSGAFVDFRSITRASAALVSTTVTLDCASKREIVFENTTALTGNHNIALSNFTNAEFIKYIFPVTGSIIITFPDGTSGQPETICSRSDVRFNDTNKQWQIQAIGTADVFEVILQKISGTRYTMVGSYPRPA